MPVAPVYDIIPFFWDRLFSAPIGSSTSLDFGNVFSGVLVLDLIVDLGEINICEFGKALSQVLIFGLIVHLGEIDICETGDERKLYLSLPLLDLNSGFCDALLWKIY